MLESTFTISHRSIRNGTRYFRGRKFAHSFLKPVPPVGRTTGPSLAAQERELSAPILHSLCSHLPHVKFIRGTRNIPVDYRRIMKPEVLLKDVRSDATGRPKSSTGVVAPVYRSRTRYQEQMWPPVVASLKRHLWRDATLFFFLSSAGASRAELAFFLLLFFFFFLFFFFLLLRFDPTSRDNNEVTSTPSRYNGGDGETHRAIKNIRGGSSGAIRGWEINSATCLPARS